MAGSQDFAEDPRNANVLIYVDGALVRREDAKVSIFDAGFTMGDGVWEGLRLHKGRLMFLNAHLDRLMAGAAKIRMAGLERTTVEKALSRTLEANGMTDGAHLRLMVTRGVKTAVNQDPRNAVGRPTIVVTAEYKAAPPRPPGWGLALRTASIRCTGPDMFDMRLNSHSRLSLIMALLEAIEADGDEALMLDPHGHVSTCNATNFFWVKDGAVFTSSGNYCFNGITRGNVVALAQANGVPLHAGDFPLEHAWGADEAFVTGTLGGLTSVKSIDGREMNASPGPLTSRLTALYNELKDAEAA